MKRIFPLLAICLALASASKAADPPQLVDLRAKYHEALAEVRDPIKQKYLNQMQEMLTRFTQEGNLQEALAVREAIRLMEQEAAGSPSNGGTTNSGGSDTDDGNTSSKPSTGTVVLSPDAATLEGALKVYRGAIVNWIRPNCRARWHDRDVPAGKYDIYFVYSAGYGQGGTVEIRDFTYSFEAKIAQTGYSSSKRIKIGTIETRGGIGMHITSKTNSKSGVMNLYRVELVPTS